MNECSDNLRPNGETFAPRTWHEYFKRRFLGAIETKLPNGKIHEEAVSTAGLDVEQFSKYVQQVETWCAKRGVFAQDE